MKANAPVVRRCTGPISNRPGILKRLGQLWTLYLRLPLGCEIAAMRVAISTAK